MRFETPSKVWHPSCHVSNPDPKGGAWLAAKASRLVLEDREQSAAEYVRGHLGWQSLPDMHPSTHTRPPHMYLLYRTSEVAGEWENVLELVIGFQNVIQEIYKATITIRKGSSSSRGQMRNDIRRIETTKVKGSAAFSIGHCQAVWICVRKSLDHVCIRIARTGIVNRQPTKLIHQLGTLSCVTKKHSDNAKGRLVTTRKMQGRHVGFSSLLRRLENLLCIVISQPFPCRRPQCLLRIVISGRRGFKSIKMNQRKIVWDIILRLHNNIMLPTPPLLIFSTNRSFIFCWLFCTHF
mmetsp:Transcript_5788/g.12857  ORF Transcript_5788/g.12857 Transcript_5788/m.12857 type:complete len:294 (+) Transcript_5788:731-1612(+)